MRIKLKHKTSITDQKEKMVNLINMTNNHSLYGLIVRYLI